MSTPQRAGTDAERLQWAIKRVQEPDKRYMVVSDPEQVEAAQTLVGAAYTVISLESAKNGMLAEITGFPLVFWPMKDDIGTARAWALELAACGEVKLINVTLAYCPTAKEMVEQKWTYNQFVTYISGKAEHSTNIVELVTANIGDAGSLPDELEKNDGISERSIDPLTRAGLGSGRNTRVKSRTGHKAKLGDLSGDDKPANFAIDHGGSRDAPSDAPPDASPVSESEAHGEPPPFDTPPPEVYRDDLDAPPVDYHPGLAGRVYAEPETRSEGAETAVPIDFWGTQGLPNMQLDQMPEFGPYVMDSANRAGVDPSMVALNCWVVAAGLIKSGISLNMQPEVADGRTWREAPVLWGACIGDAATGKGPALEIARERFLKIASRLRLQNEAALKEYDRLSKIHEKALQTYYSAAAKDPNTPQPEEPPKPPKERLWTDNATLQALAKLIFENTNGRRLSLHHDELASWWGSFDQFTAAKGADSDRPAYLSFYESKPRFVDRVGGGSYHLESWGGCILGGVQPDVLQRYVAKASGDGMIQRFMLIFAKPKTRPPAQAPDAQAQADWNRICENLAAMEPRGNSIVLSDEAAASIEEKADWINRAMQSGLQPALVASLGKWEGLIGRLAVTAHCVSDAYHDRQCPSPVVSLETVQIAWNWMHGILWPHLMQYYGGSMQTSALDATVKEFANFILARDLTEIKPHWLASNWTEYRRKVNTINLRREFWDAVCMTGWARGSGTLGRSGQIYDNYIINPAVHETFKQQKAIAKLQAQKYREIAHPAFIAAQTRELGD